MGETEERVHVMQMSPNKQTKREREGQTVRREKKKIRKKRKRIKDAFFFKKLQAEELGKDTDRQKEADRDGGGDIEKKTEMDP
jgi:hypothetical protein